jgi:hypothetical protein
VPSAAASTPAVVPAAGSRTACRLLAAWLIIDVPACRDSAVAWLERGASADKVLE